MKHIGNAKANGFWEAELPREFLKPDERTVRCAQCRHTRAVLLSHTCASRALFIDLLQTAAGGMDR